MRKGITEFSIKYPWIVLSVAVLISVFFAIQFPKIKIDTDPQNMLEADEPTRLFHSATKEDFALSDFIAVGVVAEPTAFTADMLNRLYNITAEIEEIEGVIVEDIMAPSTIDDIKQGAGGALVIEPLMEEKIETDADARYVFGRIMDNPIVRGKIASEDGKGPRIFPTG